MAKKQVTRRKAAHNKEVTAVTPYKQVFRKPQATISAAPATVKNPQSYFMRTRCNTEYLDADGNRKVCASMILLAMPWSHCPQCHHIARLQRLTPPSKCFKCGLNFVKWRLTNGVNDPSSSSEFGPATATVAA